MPRAGAITSDDRFLAKYALTGATEVLYDCSDQIRAGCFGSSPVSATDNSRRELLVSTAARAHNGRFKAVQGQFVFKMGRFIRMVTLHADRERKLVKTKYENGVPAPMKLGIESSGVADTETASEAVMKTTIPDWRDLSNMGIRVCVKLPRCHVSIARISYGTSRSRK